jgi:ribosomal protein S18 acetylase RimI-like enzyme
VKFTLTPVSWPASDALLPVLRDAEEGEERILARLADPTCTAYAAHADNALIGAAVVRWPAPSEIVYLAVAPFARRRGHGRSILSALQAELPRHGPTLIVGTANSSLDNIAFYQQCGFRMLEVHRDFFAYIDPPQSEYGIPLRDMLVFSFHAA